MARNVLCFVTGNIHTSKEQYKFDVITKVLKKEIKPGLAAKLLSISPRQVRRLKISVREHGVSATRMPLIHRLG